MKKQHLLVAAGLAAACFAAPAAAQLDWNATYFGVSSGQSHYNNVCSAHPCDDRDTNGSLFGGLQFSRYIAAEAAWRFFGHADVAGTNVKANALELDAVFNLPIYRSFSLLGRVGVAHTTLKSSRAEERTNGLTYGWGGQFDFDRWGLRIEWQRHAKLGGGDFGAETDIDSTNLGLLFRF
jgi:hypothetical protein